MCIFESHEVPTILILALSFADVLLACGADDGREYPVALAVPVRISP